MFGVLKCTFLKVSIILPKFSFNFVVVKLLVTMSVHLDYRGFRNVLIKIHWNFKLLALDSTLQKFHPNAKYKPNQMLNLPISIH